MELITQNKHKALVDPFAAINNAVSAQIDKERLLYAPEPGPELMEKGLIDGAGQEEKEEAGQEKTEAPEVKESSPEPVKIESADILRALDRNQDGDAELLIRVKKDQLLYDHAASRFYVFPLGGHHWQEDLTNEALQSLSEVADVYEGEYKRQAWLRLKAVKAEKKDEAAEHANIMTSILKRIKTLQSLRWKKDVLVLSCAGKDTLGITGNDWDKKPWSLPVLNGVIDLRTGNFQDGEPSDYFRAFAPTRWEGIGAPCPTWEAFLQSTFGDDAELLSFMGRLFGYSITGKTNEAILPILWGAGRNGKTVLLQAVADVLGSNFAGPIEAEMILESRFTRQSGGPSSDLMHLRSKRLVWLSETNKNRRINSGKVKLFTGADFITGRAPFGKRQITFRPTHKIFLCTNHRPKADAHDKALFWRIALIPFQFVFITRPDPTKINEKLADLNLAEKLRAERSGILAWLVKGCFEWQRIGLSPPKSVLAATKKYQEAEDTLKTFRSDRCNEGPEFSVRAGALYQAYRQWAEESGERPVNGNKFGEYFKEIFDSVKDRAGKTYLGIELSNGM